MSAVRRAQALALLALATVFALPLAAARRSAEKTSAAAPAAAVPHISATRNGILPTKDNLQLTLTADTGSVRIVSDATGAVRYQVRVEAEQSDPGAAALLKQFSLDAHGTARGVSLAGHMPKTREFERAWVSYEVHVPRRYNLTIATQAGNIVTQDIDGQVTLTTGGGNIQAGRVGGAHTVLAARLETGGGHILIGDVNGGLRATTAGGHITVGNVRGDATLHTDGGHIQVGRIDGAAQLTTGGGNIVAARVDSGAVAETAGGRIEFAEAAGAIHARSGGGGVRIARMAGPTELDSAAGGIVLAGVNAPLQASTPSGAITASFSPKFGSATQAAGAKQGAASELASGQGDIVVYLPRDLAVTIDALVEHGSNHRIFADPTFPLTVRSDATAGGQALHGQAALNGGGELLRLKTGAGNIQLRFVDADSERQFAGQQAALMAQALAAQRAMMLEMAQQMAAAFDDEEPGEPASGPAGASAMVRAESVQEVQPAASAGSFEGFARMFEGMWWGTVRVEPDEEQKRLQRAVRPAYPEAAREAGLQGDVTLRVMIGADGTVKDVRPLSGDAELVRTAMEAVEQWQYAPALLDGRPVNVVTTVTLAFRLQ